MFVLLMLMAAVGSMTQAAWILEEKKCSRQYNDSEFDIAFDLNFRRERGKRCIFNETLQEYSSWCTPIQVKTKVHLSPCTKEESAFFRTPPILPLVWDELPAIGGLEQYMHSVYKSLSGQRVFFCGDSFGEQLYLSFFLYLRDIGYSCSSVYHKHSRMFTCPNGLDVILSSCRLAYYAIQSIRAEMHTEVSRKHFYLINNGLWYHDIHAYKNNLKEVFNLLANVSMHNIHSKVGWWYSSDQHFPEGGSYSKYKKSHAVNRSAVTCEPHKDTFTDDFYNAQASVLQTFYPHVHPIIFKNMTKSRYDAHNHYTTSRTPNEGLDCTHYCMQPCFFEPILYEVAKFLDSSGGSE